MANELKIPKLKHFQLRKPEIQYNISHDYFTGKFVSDLMAKVVDYQNKVLCDAIIKYATEQGYTDLYLIDEQFIRSAITHEIMRRKGYAEDPELAELYETISKSYLNAQRRANDEQAD